MRVSHTNFPGAKAMALQFSRSAFAIVSAPHKSPSKLRFPRDLRNFTRILPLANCSISCIDDIVFPFLQLSSK